MINLIEQLPGYIAWKDTDHNYLGCNLNQAHVFNLKNPKKILGMSDNDFSNTTEEALKFYRHTDQLALSGKTVRIIHSIGSHDSNKSFYLEKKPMLDSDHHIVGTIFHCHEYIKNNVITILKKNDKKHCFNDSLLSQYQIIPNENPFNLSVRELECIFCILRGMTAKKIAETISLSKRTIEFYIENIKNKSGCFTKTELLISAINHGYMNIIPVRFLYLNLKNIFY